MNAPTLIVGLGGKGSEIALRVSKMLTPEQHQKIGFAVFDTDVNELRLIKEKNPHVRTIQTSTKLSVGEYLDIDTHSRDTWFPVNAILNSKTLTEGAGQVRAISRLAFETAVRAGKLEPLHEAIEDLYKLEGDEYDQALRVIIVSTIAGGTGSGLILPVALYIKNYLATRFRQSANITRGFFLLPEVLYGVIEGQAERNNLKSNAYATLRELDAFLMRGDSTLPDTYKDSVKMEFPVAGTDEFEEYNVRPFDFCFLFDAQNADGKKLNSFDKYLEHAANCIYSQSIGPMNKRSNSSEDNTIRKLAAERGRNRYAGAGSSMLIYPYEDVRDYIALNWTKECVSDQWMMFDKQFEKQARKNAKRRSQGIPTADLSQAESYVTNVDQLAANKNPFARSIKEQCVIYDKKGINIQGYKWESYLEALDKQIEVSSASGTTSLESQREDVSSALNELNDKKSIVNWTAYADAYNLLDEYRKMIERHSDETADTIAYAMFRADDEDDINETQEYQIEHYFKTDGNFIHPNAIRYFLYKVLGELEVRKNAISEDNKGILDYFDNFEQTLLGEDSEKSIESLGRKKVSIINKLAKKPTGEQSDVYDGLTEFMAKANLYRTSSILEAVYTEAIIYVQDICKAFESFFKSFSSEIKNIEKRIHMLENKHNDTKGLAARYVCASKKCMKKLLESTPYTDGYNVIDGELSKEIYNRIREYGMNSRAKDNKEFFSDLFENGIVGFFRRSVSNLYSTSVDMDIITAIEKEAEFEKEIFDLEKAELYVKHVFDESKILASPFIEKPLGEERDPINACAYNDKLNPKDDSPRSKLIDKELKNFGGEEDEDIPKNTILFYKSFYGLRANDLSKFAPGEHTETYTRPDGEYFKAYYELVSKIHPESHRSKVITPHIDRWWHNASMMPDLDEDNQRRQDYRVYAAFFWGMLNKHIQLLDDGNSNRPIYRLSSRLLKDIGEYADNNNVLVVSNSTPCDNLYEVIDALSIYPALVNKIIENTEKAVKKEVDTNVLPEAGILAKGLSEFRIREFPVDPECESDIRSIFDLPILVKKSVPTEQYYEEKVLKILDVSLSEIKKYVYRFCNESEAAPVIGNIILQQYNLYLDFIKNEQKNWSKIINDVLFITTCDKISAFLEEIGLDELSNEIIDRCEEIRNK